MQNLSKQTTSRKRYVEKILYCKMLVNLETRSIFVMAWSVLSACPSSGCPRDACIEAHWRFALHTFFFPVVVCGFMQTANIRVDPSCLSYVDP